MASKSTSEAQGDQRFYKLGPTYATKYFWAYADDATGNEMGRLGLRELASFRGTARFEAREGKVAADFMWNDLLLVVVSDRVVNLLRHHDLRGYSLYNVEITRKGAPVPGYHGIAITGTGGPNDSKAYSGEVIPGTKIRKVKGLFPTGWDGSDLFTLDDFPRAPLATERVRRAFDENKVTNCRFDPAEMFQIGY